MSHACRFALPVKVAFGTFTVRLLLSEASPASAAQAVTENARAIVGYAGPRRRLLLIDDDASHLDIVQNLLAPLGFEIQAASDGASGLARAAQCRPDLAMIDLSMPGMTGWEVAARLRADPAMAALRIVIVSANAHEFSPGGADAPHDGFIIKPIDMQRMLECLAAQLDLRWIHDISPAAAPESREASLPTHSQHHVDDLYQLGLIGHVRGIQAKLLEMESDPTNKPFANHMRTLVANFDLKRYMHVLEGMRKHA